MKYIKYILFFVLFASILSTCKKYPEGPLISLRSAEQRLLGTWRVEKYLVDEIDSTSSKYSMQTASTCYYSFIHDGNAVGDGCYQTSGAWKFNNGRSSLIFSSGNSPSSPLFLTTYIEWTILNLTNKRMHLKIIFASKKYEIFFKKSKIK